MLRKLLCDGVYVESNEFNVLIMTVSIGGNFLNWYTKKFDSQKYHTGKIVKIDTDDIETSDEDGMPMYFNTTDSDGTRIRWSTRKSRFGKPVYIWPKGSTFSIWKNGKYVNEKE